MSRDSEAWFWEFRVYGLGLPGFKSKFILLKVVLASLSQDTSTSRDAEDVGR